MAATASASWCHPGGKDKVTRKVLVIMALLQAQLPGTEAQSFGLLDPKLCYLVDGILFIYGVIITALFLRAKFGRSAAAPASQQGANQLYNELNLGGRQEYEVLDKRRGLDPEMGGKQQRRRNPPEVVYNNQRRRGKGHDGLYQGLSTATKDTYDALHMQTLPPR
ncbi:T-cell surface glycoprotein CD3 zeta chain isoform X3 [Prionailurus bengalensis]|uniref:T-cell surface glycoprotein CD3 zeta chain isoform X3 n=1 Tax=Prionailurus bengalensis TaxID=37029 RepID=UPI001CA8B16F|nr:T-cell surface glycoprotein CD3 zeta chain isoform X3 [Prionailurus bengalensis]